MFNAEKALGLYLADCRTNHASELSVSAYSRVIGSYLAFCTSEGIAPEETASVSLYKISLGTQIRLSTVQTYLVYLSAFFRFCADMGLIPANPVSRFVLPSAKKLKAERKPYGEKLLRESEIADLLDADRPHNMKQKTALRNKAIVSVLMMTGIRNSELRSLTPDDLFFGDENTSHIVIRSGKGDKFRIVPFPDEAQQAVSAYLQSSERPEGLTGSDLLFGVGDTADDWHEINRDNLSVMVKRYVANATGHEGVRSHGLRHAFASELLTHDVSMQNIQTVLGHSSMMTTERYASMLRPESSAFSANNLFNNLRKGV